MINWDFIPVVDIKEKNESEPERICHRRCCSTFKYSSLFCLHFIHTLGDSSSLRRDLQIYLEISNTNKQTTQKAECASNSEQQRLGVARRENRFSTELFKHEGFLFLHQQMTGEASSQFPAPLTWHCCKTSWLCGKQKIFTREMC